MTEQRSICKFCGMTNDVRAPFCHYCGNRATRNDSGSAKSYNTPPAKQTVTSVLTMNTSSFVISTPTQPQIGRWEKHRDVVQRISHEIAEKTAIAYSRTSWPNQKIGEAGSYSFSVTVHTEYIRITYRKAFRFDYWKGSDDTFYLYYSSFGMGNVRDNDKDSLLDAFMAYLKIDFPVAIRKHLNVCGVKFTPYVAAGKSGDSWIIGDLASLKHVDLTLNYHVVGDPTLIAW